MVVVADGKLAFSKDRVVSATQASKNFGECRRRAKREPLFVTDRNASIETVIVDYDELSSKQTSTLIRLGVRASPVARSMAVYIPMAIVKGRAADQMAK